MQVRTIARVFVAAGLALLIAVPTASAQFGAQIKVGDYGHIPVTKAASVALKILYGEMGIPGDVRDDCVYIDTTSPATLNNGLTNKDLRLTPCGEKKSGTAITDADITEKSVAPAHLAVSVKYQDLNHNAKYDKGDLVFITTAPGGDPTLTASTSPTSWTVRLTPSGAFAAGSWMFASDADFPMYGTTSPSLTNSVVERDDSVWFMVNHAAGAAPFDAKGALVLADSIRINANALLQATFKVNKLEMYNTTQPAGASFASKAEVQNTGKGPGIGVIIAKVNGVIVDAQATPMMSPGEKVTLTMKGFTPMIGTSAAYEVGDQFKQITVSGGQAVANGADTAALLERLAALEKEIATLTSTAPNSAVLASGASGTEPILPQGAGAAAKAPAPSLTILVLLLGLVVLVRRRND